MFPGHLLRWEVCIGGTVGTAALAGCRHDGGAALPEAVSLEMAWAGVCSTAYGTQLKHRCILEKHLSCRVPTSVAGCLCEICEIDSVHLCKSRLLNCRSVPLHRLQLADAAVQPLPATACPVAFALSCALDTRAGGIRITAPQQQPQPAAAPFLTASIAWAGPLPIMPGVRAAAPGSRPAAAAQRSGASNDSARYSSAVLAAAAGLLAIAGLGRRLASGGAAATVERPQQPHSQDAGKCLDSCVVFRSHTWRQNAHDVAWKGGIAVADVRGAECSRGVPLLPSSLTTLPVVLAMYDTSHGR